MDIQKPLDAMNYFKGKDVVVATKLQGLFTGKLIAFDLNINLYLEVQGETKYIPGLSLTDISLKE